MYILLFFVISICLQSCKSSQANKMTIADFDSIEVDYSDQDISIDGILNESVYHDLNRYFLTNSMTGHSVENVDYQTYFTIHHDRHKLYISITSYDQNIYSYYENRDDHLWKEECVEVFIDTDDNPQNYVELEVSPAGVLFDSFIVNSDMIDVESTSAVDLKTIKYTVSVTGTLNDATDVDEKWHSEISINLNELDKTFNPKSSKWKINFYRINRDTAAETYMAYSPTFGKFHQPDKFVICSFED